jgi:hypothetical protein
MKRNTGIALLHLPPAVERALVEQLRGIDGFASTDDAGRADVVIAQEGAADTLPPAIPVLRLPRGGRTRIGDLLRQAAQMADDAALYLEPFDIGGILFSPQEKTFGEIGLTDRETDIIAYLARQPDKAVSRDELLARVWKYSHDVDTHTLETHIYRLRQKIGRDDMLVTVPEGYLLLR